MRVAPTWLTFLDFVAALRNPRSCTTSNLSYKESNKICTYSAMSNFEAEAQVALSELQSTYGSAALEKQHVVLLVDG
jgi:hypothetical protein